MKHDCNQDSMLNSMSEDIREIRSDVKHVLGRLPVVEEKCKQSSKVTSIITSTIITFFLGVSLTVLNLTITKAMVKEKNENNKLDNITSHRD